MVVKILDESPIDLENESFVARQRRQSPLAEVLAAPLSILSHYLCTESLPGSQPLRLRSKSWPGLACVSVHWGFLQPGQAAQAAGGGRRGAGKCRSVSFPVCTVSCGQQPAPRISWREPDTQLFTRDTLHTEAKNVLLLS